MTLDFVCGAFSLVGMVCSAVGVLVISVLCILIAQGLQK